MTFDLSGYALIVGGYALKLYNVGVLIAQIVAGIALLAIVIVVVVVLILPSALFFIIFCVLYLGLSSALGAYYRLRSLLA